jgi:hypothetical protein
LLAGSGATVIGQEDQSGASTGSAIEPIVLDDAFSPIDAAEGPGPDLVDVRDTAAGAEPVHKPLALWEQLANLGHEQRTNAEIELELGGAANGADHDAAARIVALWNSGDHEAALAQLRALEEAEAPLGLGIAWRVPLARSGQRLLDYRIGGTRTEAQTMSLDYDAQNGNLFAAVRWGSTTGTSCWTMNISADSGLTWSESYSYGSTVGLIDVDCVVSDEYVYVAYVVGNATNEARMRRCLVSDGAIDSSYAFQVVFDAGANTVEDVALASNADDYDNRIYYAIIQSNDVLRYAFDAADDGTTFAEGSPASSNPEFGLDMTWDNTRNNCAEFIYISYSGTDGNIHVRGHSESDWTDWTVDTGVGSFRRTAISAYEDTIICAFEYPFNDGTGIRYAISYNCGVSWSPGTLAVPDGSSISGYFEPDVDARDGDGTAIIYQAEAGEFDPMYYRTRAGFAPGAWSDPTIFSDYDVYTGSDTAIAYLPPMAGELFSHGATYISLDPDFRTPYFDRPATAGPPCGDGTPPVVDIDSPGTLECACDLVDITGSVGDPDGTYVRDRLEIRRRGTSAWLGVDTAIGARSGVLYTLDTTGMPQDFYHLRIVGENECGLTHSDSTLVYKPTGFEDLQLSEPEDGDVYGGEVCFEGTAWTQSCFAEYTVSYRPAGAGSWKPVDPDNPVYTAPVINDLLATWKPAGLGLSDGDYDLRVIADTECGNTAVEDREVVVDNTWPIAGITSPEACAYVDGEVEVFGTAFDANLGSWTLQYTGGDASDWVTIDSGTTSVVNGPLGAWDTTSLRPCAYALRLLVTDQAVINCNNANHHWSECTVSVNVGACGDFDVDDDGDVDLFDYYWFNQAFNGPHP